MKKNVGTIDRVIRILVALVLAGLYLANVVTGTLGIILLVVAVVFLLTSFIGFCPLYLPFGINSGAKKN
jgi:hypothetical protein